MRRFALVLAILFGQQTALAGTQCISGTASMQQAITNEAGRTNGTSEFRFRATTFTTDFVFQPSVAAGQRTLILDGGWNSGCTARIAGARSTVPKVILRNAYPNTITTPDITIRGIETTFLQAFPDANAGSTILRENRINAGTGVIDASGTPFVVERNQVLGGELFLSTRTGIGDLRITNNEFRDVARLWIKSGTTNGNVLIRNNTVLFRNISGSQPIGTAFNYVEVLVTALPSALDISNNLLGRSSTFDVFPNISTGIAVVPPDGFTLAGRLSIRGNALQIAGNGIVLSSGEAEAQLQSPGTRNLTFASLPFNGSQNTPYLLPTGRFVGINAGMATALVDDTVDLRGQPRHIGAGTDIGAHESDVLFANSIE